MVSYMHILYTVIGLNYVRGLAMYDCTVKLPPKLKFNYIITTSSYILMIATVNNWL